MIQLLRVTANSANVQLVFATQLLCFLSCRHSSALAEPPPLALLEHANTAATGIYMGWFTVLFPECSVFRPSAQDHAEHEERLPSNQKHMAQACNRPMSWTSEGKLLAECQGWNRWQAVRVTLHSRGHKNTKKGKARWLAKQRGNCERRAQEI